MGALALIWCAAAALIGLALAWMTLLIGLRLAHARAAARRAADRRKVEAAFVARENMERELAPFRGRARLVAETLLAFLSLVRGADREAVLRACRAVGVDAAFRRRLTRGSLAVVLRRFGIALRGFKLREPVKKVFNQLAFLWGHCALP